MNNLMTNREFLEKVISGTIDDTVIAKAKEELAKLDKANARRNNSKIQKRELEYAPIEKAILKYLESVPYALTSEIAEHLNLSTPKTSPRCNALVEKGLAVCTDKKIKGVGTRKAYSLVQSE